MNHTKTILVADDSETVRKAVRQCFQSSLPDVAILEAANGLEAIQIAQTMEPDLLLLDVIMPELNGFEVATVLKQSNSDLPIILMSMHEVTLRGPLANAVHVDAIFHKADGIKKLVECANKLLDEATAN